MPSLSASSLTGRVITSSGRRMALTSTGAAPSLRSTRFSAAHIAGKRSASFMHRWRSPAYRLWRSFPSGLPPGLPPAYARSALTRSTKARAGPGPSLSDLVSFSPSSDLSATLTSCSTRRLASDDLTHNARRRYAARSPPSHPPAAGLPSLSASPSLALASGSCT